MSAVTAAWGGGGGRRRLLGQDAPMTGLRQQAPRLLVSGKHPAHQVVGRAQPGQDGCFAVGFDGHTREERPCAAS
jgi:hypothetical protein